MDLAAELGDTVTLGGAGGPQSVSLTAHIFAMDVICDAASRCAIAAPGEEELDHEYPYASYVQRTLRRKVGLAVPYYGVTISRESGIVIERSDGASRAVFNSDTFAMSALVEGVMTPRIYFDPAKGDYIFDGALGADAVFTDSLYAENGDIAELTVDALSTSRRIRKYILGDTSDDNFISISEQTLRFITGTLSQDVALLTESALTLLTEDEDAILEDYTGGGAAIQALNRYGQPLYWQKQPVGHTADGYPTDADGVQIYATTDETNWPVYTYDYTELEKAQFSFILDNGVYIPTMIFGAGDELGKSQGFIRKDADGLDLWFTKRSGGNNGVYIGQDYTDLVGLRKTTQINFSNWDNGSFSETADGNIVSTFLVSFDGSGYPVSITDGSGHVTEVVW